MAYDVTLDGSTFRTMMGVEPERAAEFMEEHGAHIVALNCGTGMDMERALAAVERYKSATSLPVMVQPNAGKPRLVNMKVVYDETPEQMVTGVMPLLEAGANIVGACCGSTPDHIRAFRKVMDEYLESKDWNRLGAQRESQTLRCESGRREQTAAKAHEDKSGIGVHYVDAYIKPMNVKLEDGTP